MAETKTHRRGTFGTFGKRLEEAGGEVMKAWRTQAKRHDRVGDLSYHGLEMVHGGLQFAARSLSRLEEATQPPRRTARLEPHPPTSPEPAHHARHAPVTPPPPRHPAAPAPHGPRAASS